MALLPPVHFERELKLARALLKEAVERGELAPARNEAQQRRRVYLAMADRWEQMLAEEGRTPQNGSKRD